MKVETEADNMTECSDGDQPITCHLHDVHGGQHFFHICHCYIERFGLPLVVGSTSSSGIVHAFSWSDNSTSPTTF